MSLRREHLFIGQCALLFVLCLAFILQLGRLFANTNWARLSLSQRNTHQLLPETQSFLSHLPTSLSLTYFATPKQNMPTHLKGVEDPVCDLLQAFKNHAPDKVDYRIIDPDLSGKGGLFYAARKKVSPFSVRDILHDERSERNVWSSLVVATGDRPEILIQKMTPDDIHLLEKFILSNLKAQQHTPKPIIAISAPPYFSLFRNHVKQYGEVIDIDLNKTHKIPERADVLFYFDPQMVNQAHIKSIQQFMDRGRTVVLAGSTYGIDYAHAGQMQYHAYSSGTGWATLLAPFGISPQPDLLMDTNNGPIFFRDNNGGIHQVDAPFHLRLMPGFYDLKGFLSPARGALNFVSASPLEIHPRKLSEAGFSVDILGTTTENSYVQPIPTEPFTNNHLNDNLKVGKQNLMLRLFTDSMWKGDLIVLASASPFRDGIFNQPNFAHRVFLQTFMRTFTENTRIVRGRVDRPEPIPLPELGNAARVFWRIAVVFLVPTLLIMFGAHRYFSGGGSGLALRNMGRLPVQVGLAVVFLFVASRLWTHRLAQLADFTEENVHTLLPITRQVLSGNTLKADLILPVRANLPARLKHVETTITERLADLTISYTLRRPEHLSSQDRARLTALGLRPFDVQTVRHDDRISESIISGLLLHQQDKTTAIPRLDNFTVDHLEFLLTSAQKRLTTGHISHVALISEPPRLSPAEAFEYQQQGLSPPKGADVFSQLQMLLRNYGYHVTYVNPQSKNLPTNTDLVIWMQPRRDAGHMTHLVSRYLSGGGRVLVALQHYNIQQRQYRGGGFQTVYWPQPQYQDFNAYLSPLGLEQIQEVLMDRTRARLSLETQINRLAVREFESQEVALPFLIRAVSPNFNHQSPITKHLGDQLFIWGNRFSIQTDRLHNHKLTATPLISTSNLAWAYVWSGGWLPESAFVPDSLLIGHQPLSVLVEGAFPVFTPADSVQRTPLLHHLQPNPLGQLLLVGSSEMFKNEHLYAPEFQHEQFLLNAVAFLTGGPDMAELQSRRKIARGFPYLPADDKILYRIFVVGFGPFMILLYGLLRTIRQRRIYSL